MSHTDVRELTEVWFVGRRLESKVIVWKEEDQQAVEEIVVRYHIQGIASTEEIAVAMCRDETYFIGPFPVNMALPHERCDWPRMYFPLKSDDSDTPTVPLV